MNRYFRTSISFILMGILALGAGIFIHVRTKQLQARCTEPATATVVDYVEDTEYDSDTHTTNDIYYPVVTYETAGGTVKSQSADFEYDKIYEIGYEVEIKYNPDKTEEFIFDTGDSVGGLFGILQNFPIIIGAVLILVGLGRILAPIIMAGKQK